MYALEGFLSRLAASDHALSFVLKGGVLLAAYDTRRPTRDVDLQGQHLSNDIDHILGLVRQIAAIDLDDGLEFDATAASAETIRDEDAYNGVRVTVTGRLATARLTFHVDVNVGDPVWPEPQNIELPRLLAGTISLPGYPLSMICAEKVVTAIQRGRANTRWRDFVDIAGLTGRHDISGREFDQSLRHVAGHRQVPLKPLQPALDGYADHAQSRWAAWRRKQRLDGQPERFAAVLDLVIAFADPALSGVVASKTWSAASCQWI